MPLLPLLGRFSGRQAPDRRAANGVLPPPNWDPYAPPGPSQPPALFQQEPVIPAPGVPLEPEITFEGMQRFLKELSVDYTWMAGNGGNQFGENDIELTSTFAIPIYNPQTPLLVTPGFAMNFLNGPVTSATRLWGCRAACTMPISIRPGTRQATPWLGADLAFRLGVYSDFTEVTSESIRYTGNALAVLTLTPCIQLKAGMVYLDRVLIKMLPSGGLVWTPNPDVRFEILFPNPRIMKRLATVGTTDWWLYGRGEYGGDSWTVKATCRATLSSGWTTTTSGWPWAWNSISIMGSPGCSRSGWPSIAKFSTKTATPSGPTPPSFCVPRSVSERYGESALRSRSIDGNDTPHAAPLNVGLRDGNRLLAGPDGPGLRPDPAASSDGGGGPGRARARRCRCRSRNWASLPICRWISRRRRRTSIPRPATACFRNSLWTAPGSRPAAARDWGLPTWRWPPRWRFPARRETGRC